MNLPFVAGSPKIQRRYYVGIASVLRRYDVGARIGADRDAGNAGAALGGVKGALIGAVRCGGGLAVVEWGHRSLWELDFCFVPITTASPSIPHRNGGGGGTFEVSASPLPPGEGRSASSRVAGTAWREGRERPLDPAVTPTRPANPSRRSGRPVSHAPLSLWRRGRRGCRFPSSSLRWSPEDRPP